MNQLTLNADGQIGSSFPFVFRFLSATLAGCLISTVGEPQSFTELVKLPGFVPALFASIGIAIVAIELVSFSTLAVHRRYFWYDTSFAKVSWQIITCFVVPFLTIFLLASAYYAYHGYFILDTKWTTMYGWQIFFMLLALNLVFTMGYIRTKLPSDIQKAIPNVADLTPILPESPSTTLELPQVSISFPRIIVFVIHEYGNNKVYYNDDSFTLDPRSLSDIFKLLDPDLYRLNFKKSIIRLDNVKSYFKNPKGSLKIELISPKGMFTQVSALQKRVYLGYY